MEFFQLGVHIRLFWICRKLMWVALFQMVVPCVPIGKNCGSFKSLIRLEILFGEQPKIFCQQKLI